MERDFEEWYDAFVEFVRGLGYSGPIDKDTFYSDWESGLEPMTVAKDFVDEMNED